MSVSQRYLMLLRDSLAANYPFATIDPNVGIVNLPDKRLEKLAEIFGSQNLASHRRFR